MLAADAVKEKETWKEKVAARKIRGVGMENSQVQGRSTSIYRHGLGLGFLSGPNGLEWAWPKTLNRVTLIIFHFILWHFDQTWIIGTLIFSQNKNAPAGFVSTENRAK